MMSHSTLRLPVLLLAGGLLFAACGGTDSSTADSSTADSSTAADSEPGSADTSQEPTAEAVQAPETAAGTGAGADPAPAATAPPAMAAPANGADSVLVTVDGFEITGADVDARISEMLGARLGAPPSPQQIEGYRPMLGAQLLEELIDERLLDLACEAEGVKPTDAEYRADMENEIELFLAVEGMEKDAFVSRIEAVEGVSFDEYLTEASGSEEFRRPARMMRYLKAHFPEESTIDPALIQERYEAAVETDWTKEAEVRASHILLELPDSPPEAVEAARTEAARIVELARAEGADFAALAREHSTGPSGPGGGDLGFFPRNGAMVEPFAAAAFDLEVGGVSDPVQTQFGLHVIWVSERREARTVPLEEASFLIERMLLNERLTALRKQRTTELRGDAEIVRTEAGS